MLRYVKIGFGALAMVLAMVLAAGATLRLALHAGEVPIPNLSGLTVSEASGAALHAGLDLNIENRFYSTTVPAGRILSQAPMPGAEVRKGWQVRVTESLGPQQVTIPDVVGQPLRQATMDLRRNQLDLGTEAHLDAPGEADMVLAQTPPPNAGLDQPRVNLLLSSRDAEGAEGFVMPSFLGYSYGGAVRTAEALGLRVVGIGGIPAPPPTPDAASTPGSTLPGTAMTTPAPVVPVTPVGPVLFQSPEPGHRASSGSVVRLYFYRPGNPPPASSSGVIAYPASPAMNP